MLGLRGQREGMSWEHLLRAVPRAAFLPDTVWVHQGDGSMTPVRRTDDPRRWRELCEADDAVVTQVDDGAVERGVVPTSSSSAPGLMVTMLDALHVVPGMRVLEIGTGTGYNAALLAERVGAANLTTVEVDADLAASARAALRRNGYAATVVTADGELGYPDGAPYDRVMATVAARDVPYAWVAQTIPGGRVVLPWMSAFPTGALLTLNVGADGTADGAFAEDVGFMLLRGQRVGVGGFDGDGVEVSTHLYPRELFDDDGDAMFALAAQLPELREAHFVRDGAWQLRLSEPASGSWASFTAGTNEHIVCQKGRRRLWDEFEAAYRWWVEAGKPGRRRFGMTVTPEGQRLWLDAPDNPVPS